jgi:hypothetical protein
VNQNEFPEGLVNMGLSDASGEAESHSGEATSPPSTHGTPLFFDTSSFVLVCEMSRGRRLIRAKNVGLKRFRLSGEPEFENRAFGSPEGGEILTQKA